MQVSLLYILLPLVSISSFAQSKKASLLKISERQTEWMKNELELETRQIPLISEINYKYAEKIDHAMEVNKWNAQAEEAQIAQIKLDKYMELKKILTDKQWKIYEELKLKKSNRNW